MQTNEPQTLRNDWSREEILALFDLPFNDLLFQAQTVHRQNFNPNEVQLVRCYPSRPVLAQRTVSTVHKVPDMTLVLRKKN